jgi:membrane-bound inhibitor of C-type lysozyme
MMKNIFKVLLLMVFVFSAAIAALADDAQLHGEVFIISGEEVKVMIRTPAASGEKYEALDDTDTFFWSKGGEASLTVNGKECQKFVLVRAFSDRAPDELFLTVDGVNHIMKRAVSASGVKYEAVDDPKVVLWGKGASVVLTVGDAAYSDYEIWQPLGRVWLPPTR